MARRHQAEEQLEEPEHRGAAPQDPALPHVAAGTHEEPGTSVSWVERGRCGGGQQGCTAGAVESGGAGPGDGSGEGHAHADKKYGRFPLDQRVNVDQVRSREYFYQDISFVGVIFSLFRYATVQYAFCGLLEPTMQDFCCCHLVCFVRIAPLLEGNSRETFAKKILSFKGVL